MAQQTTGIILQIKEGRAVVLTREGIFADIPLDYLAAAGSVGDTIPVTLNDAWVANSRRWIRFAAAWWRRLALAACLLILVAGGLGTYRVLAAPAYEVVIDIDPSVTLRVAADDTVRSAVANNREGAELLEHVDLVGMDVFEGVQAVIRTAQRLGYIQGSPPGTGGVPGHSEAGSATPPPAGAPPDGGWEQAVVISILPHGEQPPPAPEDLAETLHQVAQEMRISFEAGVQIVDRHDAKRARREGVPLGRWVIAQDLQERGIPLTKEEVRAAPLARLLTLVGTPDGKDGKSEVREREDDAPPVTGWSRKPGADRKQDGDDEDRPRGNSSEDGRGVQRNASDSRGGDAPRDAHPNGTQGRERDEAPPRPVPAVGAVDERSTPRKAVDKFDSDANAKGPKGNRGDRIEEEGRKGRPGQDDPDERHLRGRQRPRLILHVRVDGDRPGNPDHPGKERTNRQR